MKIIIRMDYHKASVINDPIVDFMLGKDPNRNIDGEFNVLAVIPRYLSIDEINKCTNALRILLPVIYPEFRYITARSVKHHRWDGCHFHRIHVDDIKQCISGEDLADFLLNYIKANIKE